MFLILAALSVMMTSCNKNPSNAVSEVIAESNTMSETEVEAGVESDSTAANGTSSKADIDLGDIPLKSAPDDFYFSLAWDCYGISSYDSKTGKLVKTTDATHPKDYVTTYNLTQDEKDKIYSMILYLNPEAYPDDYNPSNVFSMPSRNIILSVNYGNVDKTITCMGISLSGDPADEKGEKFLNVHNAIVTLLTSTDEWQKLPDYEVLYE